MTIEQSPGQRTGQRLVAWGGFVILAAVAVVWSLHSLTATEVMNAFSQDAGNMWQTMWNVAHGHGFTMTFSNTGEQISRLAIHADYLLILLAPLSWTNNVVWLFILQAIAVVAGAWFLWSAVTTVTGRSALGYAAAGSYLLSGAMYYPVLWGVHPLTFLFLFGLAGAEAIVRRRRSWIILLWFGLALITKEQVGLILGLVGWFLLWRSNRHRLGVTVAILGVIWTVIHFIWIIPAARTDATSHFAWQLYYSSVGETPGTQLKGLVTGTEWLTRLAHPWHLVTALGLVGPLAGIAFLSPAALAAIPAIAPHWVSDIFPNHTIFHIAHVLAAVVLLIAFIDALGRPLGRRFARWHWAPVVILFCGIGMSVVSSPYPWSAGFQAQSWQRDPTLLQIVRQRHLIPPGASLSFTRELGAQFRAHEYSALFPQSWTTVDYVAIHEPVLYGPEPNTERKAYGWYRDFLDRSQAFVTVYRNGPDRIYRRLHDQPLETVPSEYLPRRYNFY